MDLARLRVLRMLAEQGTVTATARALHLTPSAVSQQLRLLSRALGVELLRPDGRRVRLTPAALVLLDHADALNAHWERARAEVQQAGSVDAGPLRLCGLSSVLAAVVAPAAARLRADHPRLTVHIAEHETPDCYERLLADQADIALVLVTPEVPPVDDPRFTQRPLLDDPQDLLVPAGHPLAGREAAELAEAAAEPWIVQPHDNDTYPVLMAACAAAGFTPRITQHAKEWFAVSALVAHGFGVCLVPRLAPIPPQHAVVRVPLTGITPPSRRFITSVRRGSADQPLIALGLAALNDSVGSMP